MDTNLTLSMLVFVIIYRKYERWKMIFFSAVRNLKNYVTEKILVFEIF